MILLRALALLIFALSARADFIVSSEPGTPEPLSCAPKGAQPQTFTSDPFPGTWTAYDGDASVGCPVTWDSGSNSIQRTRTSALDGCDNTAGLARFDTDLGTTHGCISFRVAGYDPGTLGTATAWDGPGAVVLHQSGDPAVNYFTVACENGLDCSDLRFEGPTGIGTSICTDFGAIAVNDYMVICIDETIPTSARIKAWHLTSAPPADLAALGTPTCTDTKACSSGCDTGMRLGVAMRSESVEVGGFIRYDDVRVNAGCEDLTSLFCTLPAELPCEVQ